jgi:hypothetical protein
VKLSIARIKVGASTGTGFLVSDTGLVLTALHVIADHEASKKANQARLWGPQIRLRFGDPQNETWEPAEPAELVQGRYSIEEDWALLSIKGALGATPLPLARQRAPQDGLAFKTFGFPKVEGDDGGTYEGRIASWGLRKIELHSDGIQAGAKLPGISGAPCIVNGNVVALIVQARLDAAQGAAKPALYAVPIERAWRGCEGLVAWDDNEKVLFQDEVEVNLPVEPLALRAVGMRLGMPAARADDRTQVARRILATGITAAATALSAGNLRAESSALVIDRVGAMQLHDDAVATLRERARPALLRSALPRVRSWYVRRARPDLSVRKVIVVPPRAGHEEPVITGAPGDTLAGAAEEVVSAIRRIAEQRFGRNTVIVGRMLSSEVNEQRQFCAVLVDEPRIELADAVARRLPNAQVIVAWSVDLALREEDRLLVGEVSPVLSAAEEEHLTECWESAAIDLGVPLGDEGQ